MNAPITYLFNGDIEDVIDIFGEPNPDEDDAEDFQTIAVWRSTKWVFYYTQAEYDPWEMPEDGRHEFMVTGNIDAFEAKVASSGYVLSITKESHGHVITKDLVKMP